MPDQLAKYYEYLKANGADVAPSLESFKSTLSDEKTAKQYYSYLKDNQFDAPDTFDSFVGTFGLKKKEPIPSVSSISQSPLLTDLSFKGISEALPAQVKDKGQPVKMVDFKPVTTDNTKTIIPKLGSNQPKPPTIDDINKAIEHRVNTSTESAESVVSRFDDGDLEYDKESGKLKEVGSWLDNLGQGIKNTMDNIGLAMDIQVAKMNKNDNELKYYLNKYNEDKSRELESTYNAKGDFFKALPQEAGSFTPYLVGGVLGVDAPMMGLSHSADVAKEIWQQKPDTELDEEGQKKFDQEKINQIKNTIDDEAMIGTLQMALFNSLGITDKKQAKELLSTYAPTSKLFDASKNVLKALPLDMAKVGAVGAGGQILSNLTQMNQGREIDWKNVPEAAESFVKMDLLFKAPHIFMAGVKVLSDARKNGVDKVNPEWFNRYNADVQQQLHAIVSSPENIYNKLVNQLKQHENEPIAQDALTKIQTFRDYYKQLPSDLKPASKEKALSILQLKTEAISNAQNATESGIKAAYEQRAKTYDGLLQKLFEGEKVEDKEVLGLPAPVKIMPKEEDKVKEQEVAVEEEPIITEQEIKTPQVEEQVPEINNSNEAFQEVGNKSKKEQNPEHIGNWIIDNGQTGDRIKIDDDSYFELTRRTTKKGNVEIELMHFFKNEKGEFESNPSAMKIFTDKHRGTDMEKLNYRGAGELFEYSYTDKDGNRKIQRSEYIPKEQQTPIKYPKPFKAKDSDALIHYGEVGDKRGNKGQPLEVLEEIPISDLKLDEFADINRDNVDKYSKLDTEIPPIEVHRDEDGNLVYDGNTRVLAAKKKGQKTIKAWVSTVGEDGTFIESKENYNKKQTPIKEEVKVETPKEEIKIEEVKVETPKEEIKIEEVKPTESNKGGKELSFMTHNKEIVTGEKLTKALNTVADKMLESAKKKRKEHYASHVTDAEKDAILKKDIERSEEVRNGKGIDNFTIWQRINTELTGETPPLLPKAEDKQPTTTSEGEIIETPSSRTGGEEVEAKEVEPPTPPKPPEKDNEKGEEEPFKQKMRSFYKNVINRAKGLTADEKKLLQDNPNALYDVLPHAESRKIARELIDEIGVDKAILEATDKNSGLAPVERVMVLGAAMDYYSGLAKEQAKLGNESKANELANKEIDAQEKMLQIADTLATMGTDYGRAISIFNEVYKLSNIALERKLKNKVDEVNKSRNANTSQQAKDIAKIVSNDEAPIAEAAQDLTETQLMREADAMRKVKELEKEVEDLKKEILQRDNAAKGTKKNPLKIKRVTNDTEYDKRIKEFQQRQRSIISKEDITDLTYFGLYHIENGITKFADWYNVMNRKFGGFKDSLVDIYKNVKDKAVSNGADLKDFDTDDNIQKFFDDKKADSDAKKMISATKRAAKSKLKEIEDNDPVKARNAAPKLAAERIRKDAENNLDMPSTKKEQTYLKKLVQVINQKAKEYYKEKKENVKNINDILAFAIANGKKDYKIWERTKEEVESQIDADENLTEEQKTEVKDFLNDYTESIFDTLLTKNQIEETIRQKLIENGFGIEKVVNGKVVKSVDWNKIIGNAKNIKEAKEKIVKSIADLGINLDEAKGEIDAILNQFDSKVTDKKTAAINAYLNKGIVNKVKSALGKKQANKTQISKLVEMNNKGILNDERVKDVLAEELGIISLSKEDLAKVRDLSTQIDRDDIPEFMRKQFQEQLQYLFDSKSGNLTYLENRESVMANRLSSVYNQIQNSTGFFRVISTLATIAAKTKNPKVAAKVFGRELLNSIQDAKTILLKGRVSRGSSFSDLTMTTEGEPRVRYLEQGKGKFIGGSFLGKPLYVKIGNKSIDVNPLNQAYSRVKYVQRLLETVDTPSSGISSGLTQYWQVGKAIDKYYPELSSQEKAKKVWDIMYSLDREAEVPNAIQMLKNAGVENPTQAEVNRTINEKQERLRNDLMAKEFNKQLDSIKPIAETKLKDDGNANPTAEQIEEQAYKMLGYDEPLDVVARGERQAARETGKSTTVGITSVLLMPLDAMQKRISMAMRKNTTTSGQIAANSVDAVASQLFPFAHSIGRWTEMQLELTPYGALKGVLYKSGLARDIQGGDKSKVSKQEYSELGDDYIIRSVLGASYTVAAMGVIGLVKKMAGDDDEAEDAIIGTDKAEKFTQERVQSVGKPKQTIQIGGRNIPIQLLGNEGVILGMYADYLKKRKDPAIAEKGMLYISGAVVINSLSESGWYSNASKYGGVASSIIKGKEETYKPALGKVVGGLIGSQVPFNRGQVELATVLNPESKSSKEFGVNLQNQLSIVRAFDSTKPNFDFRGRTYEYGDIYVNSADGVKKMFSKAKYGDKIDEFLSSINFAATDAYRTTKEEDNYKFAIENKDGTKRFMTNEEYYDFKYAAAKEFNRLIELNYDVIKSEEIQSKGVVDNIKTMAAKKELASYLWNESKNKAIKDVQLQATGTSRARISRQEEREKDREQTQKEKYKNKIKGVGANY